MVSIHQDFIERAVALDSGGVGVGGAATGRSGIGPEGAQELEREKKQETH